MLRWTELGIVLQIMISADVAFGIDLALWDRFGSSASSSVQMTGLRRTYDDYSFKANILMVHGTIHCSWVHL